MNSYTIELTDDERMFYEGIAEVTDRPVEEILSDVCYKYFEKIVCMQEEE